MKGPHALGHEQLEACFALIEKTSGADYKASSTGWHPAKKKAEMRSSELRYILVRDPESSIRGFASLMPTWEEGEPVVYCYEIHLENELQGCVVVLPGRLELRAANCPQLHLFRDVCSLN